MVQTLSEEEKSTSSIQNQMNKPDKAGNSPLTATPAQEPRQWDYRLGELVQVSGPKADKPQVGDKGPGCCIRMGEIRMNCKTWMGEDGMWHVHPSLEKRLLEQRASDSKNPKAPSANPQAEVLNENEEGNVVGGDAVPSRDQGGRDAGDSQGRGVEHAVGQCGNGERPAIGGQAGQDGQGGTGTGMESGDSDKRTRLSAKQNPAPPTDERLRKLYDESAYLKDEAKAMRKADFYRPSDPVGAQTILDGYYATHIAPDPKMPTHPPAPPTFSLAKEPTVPVLREYFRKGQKFTNEKAAMIEADLYRVNKPEWAKALMDGFYGRPFTQPIPVTAPCPAGLTPAAPTPSSEPAVSAATSVSVPTAASQCSTQQLATRVRSARAAYDAAEATLKAARAEWIAYDAANAAANANAARKACRAEYMTIDADYTARTAAALRSYEADIRFLKQYILHRAARSKAARAAYDDALSAALANRDSARAALTSRTADFEAARATALAVYYDALVIIRADCDAALAADRAAALTNNEPEIRSTKKYLVRRARRVNLARATYEADRAAALAACDDALVTARNFYKITIDEEVT